MWTLIFDVSWKRDDWLRPVTGWDSRPKEITEWERITGLKWTGSGQGGKEKKMSKERHDDEITRREKAQTHAGEVISGSGVQGSPRRMPQMVSVRLDGGLVSSLRAIAEQRGLTLSDLLREGAEMVVQNAYASAQPRMRFTISGAQEALPTSAGGKVHAVN